jgi:hypothetical protein
MVRRWISVIIVLLVASAAADTISIGSNFNGTAITAGNTIWFNAVVNPALASNGTLNFTGGTVTFSAGGTNYSVALPNSTITWSSGVSIATTTFNAATNTWVTTAPLSYSGNTFLGGTGFVAPVNLAGGINPVTWSYDVSGTGGAVGSTFQWQWAAGVYTCFDTNGGIDIKPVDANNLSSFTNSDHAGTPEDFKGCVVGGARGGGGSNWTGSYSGTGSFVPTQTPAPVPEPGTLALVATGFGAVVSKRWRKK